MSLPVAIIGAGPAGLACAQHLAQNSREVVLVDDNRRPGGQYFRQLPEDYKVSPKAKLLRDKKRYDNLASALQRQGVRLLNDTVAWGTPDPMTIAYAGQRASGRIHASAVVIANGAQDKPLPFPGWTLPGVISAGGCLNLAKAHGLVPSGRVLIAGNGPLVLVAAATMMAAGANVIGVVEAQLNRRLLGSAVSGLLQAPGILQTALDYHRRILMSGNRIRTGWMVCEAQGENHIERAAIAPIGADGRPVLKQKRWIEIDTLVCGYGLTPSSEFARIMGCKTEYRAELNGLVPARSESLETSISGVFAVGDGAGIGGAEIALIEGKIAAHSILEQPVEEALIRKYHRLDRFRRRLNLAYHTGTPLNAATEETIICRCEELRLKELLADPNCMTGNVDRLKTSSRMGMGRCQGRNCLPAASIALGFSVEPFTNHPRSRPPARPIPLHQLAADAHAGAAREPDEQHAQ